MRLIFTEPAALDVDDIVSFIATDDPRAAEAVLKSISAAASRLLDFPALGHAGRRPGTREYSLSGLPYILVYEVSPQDITVLAVLHAARNISRALAARRKELDS